MEKVKIVLDADVLIHFSKADKLSLLPNILSEYEHIVLNIVYDEVKTIQHQLDNQIHFLKNIKNNEKISFDIALWEHFLFYLVININSFNRNYKKGNIYVYWGNA